jgi:glutathione S-transferase
LEQSSTGPFFLGEQFSYADAALAPFVTRMHAFDSKYLEGGKHEVIERSPRLKTYFQALINRPSVKGTYFGDEAFIEAMKTMFKTDFVKE